MAQNFFSSSWYRVANLKPRLRRQAEIHRQRYRGQLWYVLQDHASQRFHRLTPAAYLIVGLMDGERTLQAVWEMANARLGDHAPSQDEVIQLLSQLHAADVLKSDIPPDTAEVLLRFDRQRQSTWRNQFFSPLFWQFPLFDPERFLQRFLPLARPFFGAPGAILWFLVVGVALVLAAMYWQDLSENVVDRVLAPQNLFLIWLLFPILKTFHEFGHAFATKRFGGEVHDMGVMLLVLMPLPYVDASAAWAFPSKWQRILVGSAGIMVELFFASLALFIWLNVEPGIVRMAAYNVMFIAGISTVLFNGNPLLRYDGYYIFADYLEIPNLRMRSYAYVAYLCERYLLGRWDAEAEPATRGERVWFVTFAVASFLYRVFILVAIALFIAGKFFFVGVLLAVLGLAVWMGVPLMKLLAYLGTSPRLRRVRIRAVTVSAVILALVAGLIGWVPVPLRSQAEGVIWVPERGIVRARADGFVERLAAAPGSRVGRGDVLIICRDPALRKRVRVLEFQHQELAARYAALWPEDQAQAAILKEEMALVGQSLRRARELVDELTIRSNTRGTFVVPQAEDLPGRYVEKGAELGYVLDLAKNTARVVVSQADIDLVRHRTRGIEIRFAERMAEPVPARIQREVPAATDELPSRVLSNQGGGRITVDPRDSGGLKALDKLFQFDLELPSRSGLINIGGRVYVRFDHGSEPLVHRWYRELRRLFLSKFHV